MSRLKLRFCGLKLSSPIVLLSGCVGFGEEYTRIEGFSNAAVGALVLKGTTLAPRLGHPAPPPARGAAKPAGPRLGDAGRNAERERPPEPGRRLRRQDDSADTRLQGD